MPSRMIHYYLAEQILKRVEIKDKNRFRIGSVCVDMSRHDDGTKNVSHFRTCENGRHGGDWNRFVARYRQRLLEDDLYLGAFCHLVADTIWFHSITDPVIRQVAPTLEQNHMMIEIGYRDFHRLNYILAKEHGLQYEITRDQEIELPGLHLEYYDYFFEEMQKDFDEVPAKPSELILYTYDKVKQYLTHVEEICVREVQNLLAGREILDAREYFVGERRCDRIS